MYKQDFKYTQCDQKLRKIFTAHWIDGKMYIEISHWGLIKV